MPPLRSSYDPFNREVDHELEQLTAAREDHELWSLEQSLAGNAAGQRENVGVWVKPKLPPEAPPSISRS